MPHEQFPAYFTDIPGIRVYDPLAELLGAPVDGILHYSFADAVRLAGHACPTVAGAWLCTTRALQHLYGEALPQRGQITVALDEQQEDGVAGVIGSIATLVTGAAGDGGFKGLAGRYSRRSLLQFGVNGVQHLRFSRRDNGRSVDCRLDLTTVPGDPQMSVLLGMLLHDQASPEEAARFAKLWQSRVEYILRATEDNTPGLLELR